MNKQEFRKLIREEIRKVLKEASINDISDSVLKNGWGYTFNVDGNINTIVAYNAGGRDNLTASNSLNLNSVKNLTDKIGNKAVKIIQANFVNKAKKITKADLSNSNLVIVTDHNVSDPIFITQTTMSEGSLKEASIKIDPKLVSQLEKAANAYKRDQEDINNFEEVVAVLTKIYTKLGQGYQAEELAQGSMEDHRMVRGLKGALEVIKDTMELHTEEDTIDPNATYTVDIITSDFTPDNLTELSGDPMMVAKKLKKDALKGLDPSDFDAEFIKAHKLDNETYIVSTGEETVTVVGKPSSKMYGKFWSMLQSDDMEGAEKMWYRMDRASLKSQEI